MHENVPVRFGRGRLDSLGNKGLAAYLIAEEFGLGAQVDGTEGRDLRALNSYANEHQAIRPRFLAEQ
jgi:hypothetical protein